MIRNISDTARWVAHYRALESARPDALFHDPLAARIAGERGAAMARAMPRRVQFGWALAIRTRLLDDLITEIIARDGIRFVLNLAAGFDTRPYRLALPAGLRWIEVDLPPLIAEKNELLKDEKAVCRLERLVVDLADTTARQGLLSQIAKERGPGLVLTEGLLLYLDATQVTAMAAELAAAGSMRWWLTDLVSPKLMAMMSKSTGKLLSDVGAPFKFAPADPAGFFAATGWELREFHGLFENGHRLGRDVQLGWLWRFMMRFASEKSREEGRRMSGIGVLRLKD
jgi:methyltransferase (TIGR00027 family)